MTEKENNVEYHPSLKQPVNLKETMKQLEAFASSLQQQSLSVVEKATEIGSAFEKIDGVKILAEMNADQNDFLARYDAVLSKLMANADAEAELIRDLKLKLARS